MDQIANCPAHVNVAALANAAGRNNTLCIRRRVAPLLLAKVASRQRLGRRSTMTAPR
jgi:hypothetical protein